MGFNHDIETTLKEMLETDKAFKSAFEGKLKSKILDELDNVDVKDVLNTELDNMIRYMLTDDYYIYEKVRENVCEELSNRITVVIRSDKDERNEESNDKR